MAPRITLLLGKPPRPGTLLAEVARDLEARGHPVTLRLPHEQAVRVEDLDGEALVVHRGLRSELAPVLEAAHERGVRMCNPWPADRLLRDRRASWDALARARIPVPPATWVDTWPEVLARGDAGPVVAKAMAGPGRGAQVVTGTSSSLPPDQPFSGPYLVEPRLEAAELDRKLYVAGDQVRGLLKPSTLLEPHTTAGAPFMPDAALTELALEVGRALEAHLFGVDVLSTPDGPVVVDVNGFPGFRGVAGAAALVSGHLREHSEPAPRRL